MLLATNGEKFTEFEGKYKITSIFRFRDDEWRCIGERSGGFKSVKDGVVTVEDDSEYQIYLKYNFADEPSVQAIIKDLGPYYHGCGLLAIYIGETEYEVIHNLPKFVLASDGPPHPKKVMEFLGWQYDEDNIWNSYF